MNVRTLIDPKHVDKSGHDDTHNYDVRDGYQFTVNGKVCTGFALPKDPFHPYRIFGEFGTLEVSEAELRRSTYRQVGHTVGLRDEYGSGYNQDEAHDRVSRMSDTEVYQRMADAEVILEVLCAGQNRAQWMAVLGGLDRIRQLVDHAQTTHRLDIPTPNHKE